MKKTKKLVFTPNTIRTLSEGTLRRANGALPVRCTGGESGCNLSNDLWYSCDVKLTEINCLQPTQNCNQTLQTACC